MNEKKAKTATAIRIIITAKIQEIRYWIKTQIHAIKLLKMNKFK